MKFIFPTNYNFKSKIFGVLDYNTAILNVIWMLFIYCLISIFFSNISAKIVLFIILCLPFLLLSIIGFNNENFIYVLKYMLKYLLSPKLYLYRKDL